MTQFTNHYSCPTCGTSWSDKHDCMCNDRCPICNAEIEPLYSMDEDGDLYEYSTRLATRVAEWVGLHYGRNFKKESATAKQDWVERYIEAHEDDTPHATTTPTHAATLTSHHQPITFNEAQALAEGWNLYTVDGRVLLQRIDVPSDHEFLDYKEPKFPSDADAIIFVALRAYSGSTYHRNALERIGTLAQVSS